MYHRTSLNHHLYAVSQAPDQLRFLLLDIARAGKYIQHAIRMTEAGLSGQANQFGEMQEKLDVLSDEIIRQELAESRLVSGCVSEEQPTLVPLRPGAPYCVVFDPLDGSSLTDVNFSVGSIFGIYAGGEVIGRKPSEQVAALYFLYGPRTLLVYSTGNGVHLFLLNDVGEFVLLREFLSVGQQATTFAPGNLAATSDSRGFARVVEGWKSSGKVLRYSGCMVADIHHIFAKGQGVYAYVGGRKYPEGKLRLVFECGPFAYLAHHAGGAASDGALPIMEKEITSIDQRTPIIIGSTEDVVAAAKLMKTAV